MRNLITRQQQPSVWDFMNQVEKIFDDSWTGQTSKKETAIFDPKIDIKETSEHYLIAADLPGLNQSQVKINIENGRLILSGERSEETVEDTVNSHRRERVFGRFERSFQLPTGVNEEQIQARLEDGVLEVLIPKPQVAKPKAVAIEAEKKGLFSKLLGAIQAPAEPATKDNQEKH